MPFLSISSQKAGEVPESAMVWTKVATSKANFHFAECPARGSKSLRNGLVEPGGQLVYPYAGDDLDFVTLDMINGS